MIDSALQIWPNNTNLLGEKAYVLQARGQLDEAQAILSKLSFDGPELDSSGNAPRYQSRVRREFSVALKVFDAHAHGPEGNDPQFLLGLGGFFKKQAGRSRWKRKPRSTPQSGSSSFLELATPRSSQITSQCDRLHLSLLLARSRPQRDDALKMLAQYDVCGDWRCSQRWDRARFLLSTLLWSVSLGDKDGAIASLEQLLAGPSDPIYAVPVTPAYSSLSILDFDSLHGDPAFRKTLPGENEVSDKPTFFSELKRRNVYKVAVAYVVVSWLIVQAASIMLPTFEAPTWVMKVVIGALVLGFPIALGFSWAFEITPEGIKRESDVASEQSITAHTGRKLVGLTIAPGCSSRQACSPFRCCARKRHTWRRVELRRRCPFGKRSRRSSTLHGQCARRLLQKASPFSHSRI